MKATVAQNFGLEVDNVVVTTFGGFEKLVDALGGVTVNNPYELVDNEYPTIDYGYTSIYFPAGEQTLNGEQALQFVRTRHQDGDGGRVMRQQLVLRALLERARDPEVADELPEIVKEHRRTVKTDLGPSKHLAFALAAPDFTNENVAFADLNAYVYEDTAPNGAFIYSGDWTQINGFVQGFLDGAIEVPQNYVTAT
jgi:anionic cell wall polymer biosynthesis LytR-Cps2A-Psr (LCP) family protein